MLKNLLFILLILFSTNASAQTSEEDVIKSRKDFVDSFASKTAVESEPGLKLAETAVTPKSVVIKNMTGHFYIIAKAWWIQHQCKILKPAEENDFAGNIEVARSFLTTAISIEQNIEGKDAHQKTENIVMYAYRSFLPNHFYDCKEPAQTILMKGIAEAKTWRTALDPNNEFPVKNNSVSQTGK